MELINFFLGFLFIGAVFAAPLADLHIDIRNSEEQIWPELKPNFNPLKPESTNANTLKQLEQKEPENKKDKPKIIEEIPIPPEEITPKSIEEFPKIAVELPKILKEIPKLDEESPKIAVELPKILEKIPNLSVKSPKIAVELPKILEEIPKLGEESLKKDEEPPKINITYDFSDFQDYHPETDSEEDDEEFDDSSSEGHYGSEEHKSIHDGLFGLHTQEEESFRHGGHSGRDNGPYGHV